MDKIIEQDCLEYIKKVDLAPLRDKTVLITGANGRIGTYLIYMLHLENIVEGAGINIVAISKNFPCEALRDIFAHNYEFHILDFNKIDYNDLHQKADYIIHGANYDQPDKFLQNYLNTIRLNTSTTENLLQKAKNDEAKFLFLSPVEVYGESGEENIPTIEDYPRICSSVNSESIYSEFKRMGETLCFAYKNFEGVDAKIVRIAITYGPGAKLNDEWVPNSVLMLINILLYGTDFVYNVGSVDSVSVRSLAEKICSLTGITIAGEES